MRLFLSYRRADTQSLALLLARTLSAESGIDAVFFDQDGIELAEDFRRKIALSLSEATHVLVLIGPQWAGPADHAGQTRLFRSDDVVRQEVAQALSLSSRGATKVVPLLVDATAMPSAPSLPPELVPLATLNAFTLRAGHFDDDVAALLRRLTGGDPPRRASRSSRVFPVVWRLLSGAAVGGAVVLITALINFLVLRQTLSKTVGNVIGVAGDDAFVAMLALSSLVVVLCMRLSFKRRPG